MSTWAEWRENAKTPFRKGEVVRMEDGRRLRARVPEKLAERVKSDKDMPIFRRHRWKRRGSLDGAG